MQQILGAVASAGKKATILFVCTMVCVMFHTSCSNDDHEGEFDVNINPPQGMRDTTVVISFVPRYQITPMTRAAISDAASRLDMWIYDGDTEVADVHQSSSEDGFGSVSLTLEKTKTYTVYAMAHKGDGAATLSDGVISFTDDKVRDTFWYTATFSPSESATITAVMCRIVAQFRLMITDDIPEEVKKMRITVGSVYDRWNVSGSGVHQIDRISTVSYGGTSKNFSVYAIVSDEQTLHQVTVEALDASDGVVQSRSFSDVPLKNNFKTVYSGRFFTNTMMSLSFTTEDWNEYDAVTF